MRFMRRPSAEKRLKNRIDSVYDFDGPGFIKEITADAQYLEIAPRIHKFVPQSSVIGRLLAAGEKSVAVMSDERGLRQHDLYSWRVVPPGEMERAESLNLEFVGNMLNDWISGMDIEERKSFLTPAIWCCPPRMRLRSPSFPAERAL